MAHLIDWLTLRYPLDNLGDAGVELFDRFRSAMGILQRTSAEGELVYRKPVLDVDALRSDSVGVFWSIQGSAEGRMWMVIGGSPASLAYGNNTFGSMDIQQCAATVVHAASKELGYILPYAALWQCQRIDVTGNYGLPDAPMVKQSLRALLNSDSVRRKAQSDSKGGDSVYWSPNSDLIKGKAYHKGPQLRHLVKRGKLTISDEFLALADKLLRLELTLGSRWFRRLREAKGPGAWWYLDSQQLIAKHVQFFEPLAGGLEVSKMNRYELVGRIMEANGISEGRALAAFNTYRNIREFGYEDQKASMPERTFRLHRKYLRTAGISDADMMAGNVVPFRAAVRVIVANPVGSWDELRAAA